MPPLLPSDQGRRAASVSQIAVAWERASFRWPTPSRKCCDLTISVVHIRYSYGAVPTITRLCCKHVLPSQAGSSASAPTAVLDFAISHAEGVNAEGLTRLGMPKTDGPGYWRSTGSKTGASLEILALRQQPGILTRKYTGLCTSAETYPMTNRFPSVTLNDV